MKKASIVEEKQVIDYRTAENMYGKVITQGMWLRSIYTNDEVVVCTEDSSINRNSFEGVHISGVFQGVKSFNLGKASFTEFEGKIAY